MGAVPESQIKAFIERLVGPVGPAPTVRCSRPAQELMAAGDLAARRKPSPACWRFMEPENLAALAGLARVQMETGNLEQARRILEIGARGQAGRRGDRRRARPARTGRAAASLGDLADFEQRIAADPADHQARYDLAVALNAKGFRGEAADHLLEIIRRDRTWNEDGARKQLCSSSRPGVRWTSLP
jgi:putative thioredoxin